MSLSTQAEYEVAAALEQWTDQRVIHADDLETLLLWWLYVPNELSQFGFKLRGFTFRQREGMWLLTVKVEESGAPLVVFLTSATTTGCIRLFVSQLAGDRLSWVRDKFPVN